MHEAAQVNRDGLVGQWKISSCLGHSDHEWLFQIFDNMRKIVSKAATLGFGRADFRLLKELVSNVVWESAFKGIAGHF